MKQFYETVCCQWARHMENIGNMSKLRWLSIVRYGECISEVESWNYSHNYKLIEITDVIKVPIEQNFSIWYLPNSVKRQEEKELPMFVPYFSLDKCRDSPLRSGEDNIQGSIWAKTGVEGKFAKMASIWSWGTLCVSKCLEFIFHTVELFERLWRVKMCTNMCTLGWVFGH